MSIYKILLIVSYKASARDPEGETIAHELKSLGYKEVIKVRVGKAFFFDIEAKDKEEASEKIKKIAFETKLHNPNVHDIMVISIV